MEDRGRREDDLGVEFGPLKIKATGKTVTTMILWIILGAVVVFHHWESERVLREMAQALWVQNWILAHPEKERKAVLSRLPPDVRHKITTQELPQPPTP